MSSRLHDRESGEVGYRSVSFFDSDVELVRRSDDVCILRNAEALTPHGHNVGAWLDHWAAVAPARPFIVEQQAAGGERIITYEQAHACVKDLARGLLELELSLDRPIVMLGVNSVDHALIMLAGIYIGVPFAPIAPAYALQTRDYSKLARCLSLLTPGAVFVDDGAAYSAAIEAALHDDVPVVAIKNAVPGMRALHDLSRHGSDEHLVRAHCSVQRETVAKFLFTSGSTGAPKAVVNTHGMLCANAQMQRRVSPFLASQPPIMVDWLPWNHTAGGNSNFNIVLYNGGTLYIDPGKPTPDQIGKTIELLRRVSPTLYFNVPMGYEALIPHLQSDAELRVRFFRDLKFLWYAAAAMQPATWAALESLAVKTLGCKLLMVSGLGMTETSPLALFGNKRASGPGVIGVPVPGVELKLVRRDDLWEARYRGPNVTPGYWRDPEATQEAFDAEGFFMSGDLLSFVDPDDPGAGLSFQGRLQEDFKLSTGTKVAAGALRLSTLYILGSLATDVVIAGEGRDDVRMLILPNWDACLEAAAIEERLEPARAVLDMRIKALFQTRLLRITGEGSGTANRIVAAMLTDARPSPEHGELTEKGTINARAFIRNRKDLLDALYSTKPDERILWG